MVAPDAWRRRFKLAAGNRDRMAYAEKLTREQFMLIEAVLERGWVNEYRAFIFAVGRVPDAQYGLHDYKNFLDYN